MLIASSWQPPQQLLALKSYSYRPYEIQITTPGFSQWGGPTRTELTGTAHVEQDFAIGSGAAVQDLTGYFDHTATFRIMLRGLQPVGAIECYQPYWHGDEGEDAWDTDRSSPFEQTWQYGRRGVLLFDIPSTDPAHPTAANGFFAERAKTASHLHQLADCRLPAAASELHVTANGVFARYGPVFVALQSLGPEPVEVNRSPRGSNLSGFMTLKVRAAHAALFYRVEPAAPGEPLAAFEQLVQAEPPQYSQSADRVVVPLGGGHSADIHFDQAFPGATEPSTGVVARSPLFTWAHSQVYFSNGGS